MNHNRGDSLGGEEYSDDTIGELYMKMLKDSEPHAPDYPGAGEEYIRRYREHQRQQRTE